MWLDCVLLGVFYALTAGRALVRCGGFSLEATDSNVEDASIFETTDAE